MENEKLNNTQHEETKDSQKERTFTQAEVEELIGRRLARERKKYERETGQTEGQDTGASERESELTSREMRVMAKEKLLDKGLPLELADCLKFEDEETLEKAIETITGLDLSGPRKASWGQRVSGGIPKASGDPTRKAFGLE